MNRRGRKKGANGEQSRELLLLIAAEEFASKGYFGTKVSTIVQRANVSQPTFYLYFTSKEAIFQELIAKFERELFTLIRKSQLEAEAGLEVKTVSGVISRRLENILRFFADNECLTKIGFFLARDAIGIKQQLVEEIHENLLFEQQNGYLDSEQDMVTAAESLVGIIERLTVTRIFNGDKEPDQLANEITQLLLAGMISKNT